MRRYKIALTIAAIAASATVTTFAVTAHETANEKFPHERMVEIRRIMGGEI